jgi:hypothetical protein
VWRMAGDGVAHSGELAAVRVGRSVRVPGRAGHEGRRAAVIEAG